VSVPVGGHKLRGAHDMRTYKGKKVVVGAGFTPALLRVAWTLFVLWSLRLHCQAGAWRSQGGRTSAMANMAVKSGMKKGSDEAPFFCVLHNALGSREGCPYRFLFKSFP